MPRVFLLAMLPSLVLVSVAWALERDSLPRRFYGAVTDGWRTVVGVAAGWCREVAERLWLV